MRRNEFAAYDLLQKLFHAGEWVWATELSLKGIDATARPLKVSVDPKTEGGSTREMTFKENRDYAVYTHATLNTQVFAIRQFVNRLPSGFCDFSYQRHQKTDADIELVNIEKVVLDTSGASTCVSKSDLESLGELAAQFTPRIDAPPQPASMGQHQLDSANNLLDVMSYELRGINNHTGQVWTSDIEAIKKRIGQRLQAANNSRQMIPNDSEGQLFISMFDYVKAEYKQAKNLSQLTKIADYLEANVPKLILVRRWWAL